MTSHLKRREREQKLEKIRGKVRSSSNNGPKKIPGKPYTRDEMIGAMGGIESETGSLDRIDSMTLTEALEGVARGYYWTPKSDPSLRRIYGEAADHVTEWISSGEARFSWADLREWVKREGASAGWATENLR